VAGVIAWVFLWFSVVKVTHLPRWAGWVITILGTLALIGGGTALVLSRSLGATHHRLTLVVASTCLVVLMYFALSLIVVDAVNLVWWLIERHRRVNTRARLAVIRILTVLALIVGLTVTGWGYVKNEHILLDRIELSFPELPGQFDGVTVALLTDLHVGATTRPGFLSDLVDQVNATHPDLIVIAGDLEDGSVDELGSKMKELTKLDSSWPVFVTTGNHEFNSNAQAWIDYFDSIGLTVLDNDGAKLTREGASIEVLGINDVRGTGSLAPDLNLACRRANAGSCSSDDGVFRLLAAHEPVQALMDDDLPARLGVDLQLSGHTHGGQLWPLGLATLIEQPVLQGVHDIGGVTTVTSRGVGGWGPPVRVGADPEIVLITLRASA
jgi:predicted MPP superfamily phosphohydrolase